MGCALTKQLPKRAKRYLITAGGRSDAPGAGQAAATPKGSSITCTADVTTSGSTAHRAAAKTPAAAAAAAKPRLDPKEFTFSDCIAETCIKLPGAVAGQQFIIEGCKDCDLFVLDHTACVTIDDCTNCRILIGPTEASIFIRGCSGCSVAAITRQLRCRDCSGCRLLLLCRTRPIIEACTGMAFGCFDAPYAGLAAQMAAAQLSPFHNFWSDVYDFTPPQPPGAAAAATAAAAAAAAGALAAGAGGGSAGSGAAAAAAAVGAPRNWELLPDDVSVRQLLGHPGLPQPVELLMPAGPQQQQQQQQWAGTCEGTCVHSTCSTAGTVNAAATNKPRSSSSSSSSSIGGVEPGGSASSAGSGASPVSEMAAAGASAPLQCQGVQPLLSLTMQDQQCVIKTRPGVPPVTDHPMEAGQGAADAAGTRATDELLFILFPAGGSRQAALQWVFDHVQHTAQELHAQPLARGQQQQQLLLLQQEPQQQQPAGGEQEHAASPTVGAQSEASTCTSTPAHTEGGPVCASGDSGTGGTGSSEPAAPATSAVVLLHTNEAALPVAARAQLASAAGWSKHQVKQLNGSKAGGAAAAAAACIGLQVVCRGQGAAQRLGAGAEAAGAMWCSSLAAAQLFRSLGLDG